MAENFNIDLQSVLLLFKVTKLFGDDKIFDLKCLDWGRGRI